MDKSHNNKDTNKDILSFGKFPMLSNYNFYYAYKKSSKLMSAIYVLTDSNGSNGQIKDELRDNSKTLIKDILSLSDDPRQNNFGSLAETRILFIHSLIDTARIIGLIDIEVARIFHEEYSELHDVVVNLTKVSTNDRRVLGVVSEINLNLKEESDAYNKYKQNDNLVDPYFSSFDKNKVKNNKDENTSVVFKDKTIQNTKDIKKDMPNRQYQSQKDIQREEIALKVIKDNGGASIKDISILMPEISEKTVQRMLISLLERGSIRKEGERRWSRYYSV